MKPFFIFFLDQSNEKRLCWRETLVASVLHMLSLSKCPAQAQQTMKYTEGLKSTQKWKIHEHELKQMNREQIPY